MYTEPIYKVIHKETNTSLPQVFTTFMEAFRVRNKWSSEATIECYVGETTEVVWDPSWENINLCEV